MFEVIAAAEAVKKLYDALGVIGEVLGRLRGQPDVAALKLAEALDEIGKTYQAVDKAITDFLRLGIDQDGLEKGSELLLKMQGGGLAVEVEKGRGHCHVISNIYDKYLDRWFNRALLDPDLRSMQAVFADLRVSDFTVFDMMTSIAYKLQHSADEVLKKVQNEQADEAKDEVMAAGKELLPIRIAMSEGLRLLYTLKGEFIKIGEIA